MLEQPCLLASSRSPVSLCCVCCCFPEMAELPSNPHFKGEGNFYLAQVKYKLVYISKSHELTINKRADISSHGFMDTQACSWDGTMSSHPQKKRVSWALVCFNEILLKTWEGTWEIKGGGGSTINTGRERGKMWEHTPLERESGSCCRKAVSSFSSKN